MERTPNSLKRRFVLVAFEKEMNGQSERIRCHVGVFDFEHTLLFWNVSWFGNLELVAMAEGVAHCNRGVGSQTDVGVGARASV